ncbi:MAG: HAD family hydrolase [Candidatus Caldarchaeum sp.]
MKAVFFDVDGTLYRSREYEEYLLSEIVAVISEFLETSRSESYRRLADVKKAVKTVSKSVELLGIDRKKFYDRLAERVSPNLYIFPKSDVAGLLQNLRKKNFFVGLHTNSGRRLAEKVLKSLGIQSDCYDVIVTSDDAEPKPHPEGFLLLLRHAGCNPSRALYVGDRCEVELEPAKKLGMNTAGIYVSNCVYADYVLNSLQDLLNII